MKVKINKNSIMFFLLIIPFLFPIGFAEYNSAYKLFYTTWMYVSIAIIYVITVLFVRKKKKEINLSFFESIIVYFVVMALITFLLRGTFEDALKKLFAAPALCFLLIFSLQKKPRQVLEISSKILCIVFVLNLTMFNPLIWPQYFSPITNHLMFLGHVQIAAQLSMLGLILAYIEYRFFGFSKLRFWIQTVLSVVTMLSSFTSASYLAILFLILFWILNKTRLYKIFTLRGQIYIYIYIFVNVLLLYFIYTGNKSFEILGFSLNGRGYIWEQAINSFIESPICGYGAHGVLIRTFWSSWTDDGFGMNYMHNQLLQVLNDGGVILLIPFIWMFRSAFKQINKVANGNERFWLTSFVLIILIILTFESGMEYFYMFFILSIYAYLPNIIIGDDNYDRN